MSHYRELTNEKCKSCNGSGMKDSHYGIFEDDNTCLSCDGHGVILVDYNPDIHCP